MLHRFLTRLTPIGERRGRRRSIRPQGRHRPGIARLGVEALEDRRLLSSSPWAAPFARAFGNAATHVASSHSSFVPAAVATSASAAAATTVTLQNRPSTSFYGQSIQLTAKITGATGGSVVFSDTFNGATAQLDASPINVSNGYARFAINTLAVGTHSIIAQYTDSSGVTTSSSAIAETVKAASTRTIVTAATNPVVLTGSNTTADVTFTAIVSSGGFCGGASAQTGIPTGSVTFTVTNTADNTTTTDTATLDATGKASYTPSLAAGAYNVTVTYNGDGNYAASSTPRPLVEQVVAQSAIGTGTVQTTGTSDSNITLRGGQTLSIDVAQTLDAANNVLTETGAGVTYVDSTRGINLMVKSADITSVVFDSNGYVAQIVGNGTNTAADGTTTAVTFVMYVNGGGDGECSRPAVNIMITGAGINYRQSGTVSSGAISVAGTGSTVTVQQPQGSHHDRGLQSWLGDSEGPGLGFGFRGWHRGRR